jgi:exonuclease III
MSTTSHTRSADESSKRQKTCHDDEAGDEVQDSHPRHPHSFVTWNCNGLTSRCCFNLVDLKRLLEETSQPDMICLQEVRLAAIGPIGRQRGIPKKDDAKKNKSSHKSVQETLNAVKSVFGEYKPFWSLADKMYAGTLTLIHQRLLLEDSSNDFAAFTPQSAIDLMLRRLGNKTRQECGLSKPSPAKKQQQTSMTSFFSPKQQAQVVNSDHDTEGRFQFFFFPDMDVVHTYVPNNGGTTESFERRRNWDENLLQFWKDRKQVLDSCSNSNEVTSSIGIANINKDRKLLWCGDLNVARDYRDGTHWERRGPSSTEIYEWWTDESKCFDQDNLQKNPTRNKKAENVGMPSFTPAERSRFNEMIQEADFCDVWRELHPNGVATLRKIEDNKDDNGGSTTATTTARINPWDLPNYTWRGHASIKPGERPAKYEGRGQRLDYFLLSPSSSRLVVESCEILGQGERKEGLFCGSDHCAVSLNM